MPSSLLNFFMQQIDFNAISVDQISGTFLKEKNIEIDVLRLDKIHPEISGNKWFKLSLHIKQAVKENKNTIVTFGGAWSNHILATAAACRLYKLDSIGIIRGEESNVPTLMLQQAVAAGMKLVYVNRTEYRNKNIPVSIQNPNNYYIDEGGYGETGAAGATAMLNFCHKDKYSHICCAAGTGTMAAGLINASIALTNITAISVLKNNHELEKKIQSLVKHQRQNLSVIHDYHFGGYAKYKPSLIRFMNEYYSYTNIPSDFVYTGKLFFAIDDLIHNNYFAPGSRLLLIHSGGLQGNRSLNKGVLIF